MNVKKFLNLKNLLSEFHKADVEMHGEYAARVMLVSLIAVIITKHWQLPEEEVENIMVGLERIRRELKGNVTLN
jgi:hypothetical protein